MKMPRLTISVPMVWLLLFVLWPVVILLRISVSQMELSTLSEWLVWEAGTPRLQLHGEHLAALWHDELYWRTMLHSLKYAAITTVVCLVMAYPCAWAMARTPRRWQLPLVMAVTAPFWTSVLLRVYAWKGLLNEGGWLALAFNAVSLDQLLLWLGWTPMPGQYLYTAFSLVSGLVYTYLPFMVLPVYASLVQQDRRWLEAAADLGATPWQAFVQITWPLSRPGVMAGACLVFVPCVGEFVIPTLLGGPETHLIGRVMWDDFFANDDWPMAASTAVGLLLLMLLPLVWFTRVHTPALLAGLRRGRRPA